MRKLPQEACGNVSRRSASLGSIIDSYNNHKENYVIEYTWVLSSGAINKLKSTLINYCSSAVCPLLKNSQFLQSDHFSKKVLHLQETCFGTVRKLLVSFVSAKIKFREQFTISKGKTKGCQFLSS